MNLPAPSAWRYTHHIPDGTISYQYDTARPKNCNHPNYTPMFTQGQLNQYGQACFEEGREARAIVEPAGEYPALPGRTIDELTESQRESAIAAYRAAHEQDPDFGFAPDRAWVEGAAYVTALAAGQATTQPAPQQEARAALASQVQPVGATDANYDLIDRFLRNNLYDDDYAEYSAALDALASAPAQSVAEPGTAYAAMPDAPEQ